MFKLKLITHKNLSQICLEEIIQIKSIAWPYSYEKQLDWINSNINETDIHVLLYSNDYIVSYLNLLELNFKIDGSFKIGYGIGNVCSRVKGKGWGKELIRRTNSFLFQKNIIAFLFCKDLLVDFYKLNDWKLIEKENLTLSFSNEAIQTMIYNWDNNIHNFEYTGRSF